MKIQAQLKRGSAGKTEQRREVEGTKKDTRIRVRAPRSIPTLPPAGLPVEPPDFLDDIAATEWRRMQPLLVECGLTGHIDAGVFASYCQAWSQFAHWCMKAKVEPVWITKKVGGTKVNPIHREVTKASHELMRLIIHMGLTPAMRAQMTRPTMVQPGEQTDEPVEENPFELASGM